MGLSMSGADPQDMGLASGLINATVQVGGAIGLAVLATLAASRTDALTADGQSAVAALNGGFHVAYLLGAVPDRRRDHRGGGDPALAEAPRRWRR